MMRKQIYIDSRQDRLLKRKAAELNTTESELIRNGIEKLLTSGTTIHHDIRAWEAEKKYIQSRLKKGLVRGGKRWKREELHNR
jgi:hypothetical protein